jgi:arylformamidase
VEIYDISQTLREGMVVWPGDRPFRSEWTMRISDGASCNVSAVTMSTHTGTHIDAPFHCDESGAGVAAIPAAHFVGPVRVVEIAAGRSIGAADLQRLGIHEVQRLLFKTRSGGLIGHEYDPGFVYLAEDGAEYLARLGLLLVGTDAPSVDAFDSKTLPSHGILSRHHVAILEGAVLDAVPPGDYELICLPLKLAGLDGSPVRAILRR